MEAGARRLTPGHRFGNAVWSPDGRKIGFRVNESSPGWLYLMNPDGSGKRKFTRLDTGEWTSAGLAYFATHGVGFVKPNGSAGRVVFRFGNVWDVSELSRDGRSVALSGPLLPHGDLELGVATKSGVRRLTDNDRQDIAPSFSPDRKSLVFEAFRTPSKGENHVPPGDIYLIKTDGSGERELTKTRLSESAPSWAPGPR